MKVKIPVEMEDIKNGQRSSSNCPAGLASKRQFKNHKYIEVNWGKIGNQSDSSSNVTVSVHGPRYKFEFELTPQQGKLIRNWEDKGIEFEPFTIEIDL